MVVAITGKDSVCKEICAALGLSHVRKLDIHMALSEIVVVTVEYMPEGKDLEKLIPILKRYNLVPDVSDVRPPPK